MTHDGAPDLAGLCAELAGELEDVSTTTDGEVIVYARGNDEFARVTHSTLEVLLPADIAEAALLTTDTSAGGEPGWIRFAPRGDERYVTDRAAAWFQTGWQHATR